MTHHPSSSLLSPRNARLEEAAGDVRDRPRYDARALTGSGGDAEIVLDGKIYHLRITRQGKLILNK